MNITHPKNKAGIVALIFIFFIQGCASTSSCYQPNESTVGTLRVVGNNDVWVNNNKAEDKQLIRSGDSVKVGVLSSAYLYFLSKGFVHLDENTDPVFELIWDRSQCFIRIFRLNRGQMYEETNHECPTVVKTPHTSVQQKGSIFNLKVNQQQSVLTVLEGDMEILTPKSLLITRGQQITVSGKGAGQIVQLTEAELDAVIQWRAKYPPPAEEGSLTWSKIWPVAAKVAVAAGVVAGSVLVGIAVGKREQQEEDNRR